jgi:hypothetical protein
MDAFGALGTLVSDEFMADQELEQLLAMVGWLPEEVSGNRCDVWLAAQVSLPLLLRCSPAAAAASTHAAS